jgi:hypothetical protein
MAKLIHIEFSCGPVGLGDISYLDITLRDVLPGPLALALELDPHLPYVFSVAGKELKKISRRRRIPAGADEFSTRIAFRISNCGHTATDPIITITASGVDGTTTPYRLALNVGSEH